MRMLFRIASVQLLILTCLFRGTNCDIFEVDPNIKSNSNCAHGIIENTPFVMTWTVNNTGIDNTEWPLRIEFQKLEKNKKTFTTVCTVFLDLCSGVPDKDCDCVRNGDIYSVFINTVADSTYDNAQVRFFWSNQGGTDSMISTAWDFGPVEDPTTKGVLTPSTIKGSLDTPDCLFEIRNEVEVKYCCESSLRPRGATITANGSVTNDNCASIGVLDNGTTYSFSLTVCGNSYPTGSCIGIVGVPETSTVSTTTVSQKTVTEVPGGWTCDKPCYIPIIVVIVIIIIIIIIILFVFRWKKRVNKVCWVIQIKENDSLQELEKKLKKQQHKPGDGEFVFLHNGEKQQNKDVTMRDLFEDFSESGTVKVVAVGHGANEYEIKDISAGVHTDSWLVSPPTLTVSDEVKPKSQEVSHSHDQVRKKRRKRRKKTNPPAEFNRDHYTDAPAEIVDNSQKSSEIVTNTWNGSDHGDDHHKPEVKPRRLLPIPTNKNQEANRNLQKTGFSLEQPTQKSRPPSIEMTSRPLPQPSKI